MKPWVLRGYDGGDIVLNEAEGIVMRAADYPNLAQYVGQDLVLTDGTTLLGGDDKAAIAALMTLAEFYADHPELPHRSICLAFTPDEEVGGLAQDLDLDRWARNSPTPWTATTWAGIRIRPSTPPRRRSRSRAAASTPPRRRASWSTPPTLPPSS